MKTYWRKAKTHYEPLGQAHEVATCRCVSFVDEHWGGSTTLTLKPFTSDPLPLTLKPYTLKPCTLKPYTLKPYALKLCNLQPPPYIPPLDPRLGSPDGGVRRCPYHCPRPRPCSCTVQPPHPRALPGQGHAVQHLSLPNLPTGRAHQPRTVCHCSGFEDLGRGLRVWGLLFRMYGAGFMVYGLTIRV